MWFDSNTRRADGLVLQPILEQLRARLEQLERRPYEQALRPCVHCGGRAFRISTERTIEHVGKIRVVVCDACGAMQMFWVDRHTLTSPMFGEPVTVPDAGGPFR